MNKRGFLVGGGSLLAFREKITDYSNLELVNVSEIYFFMIIPFWISGRVMLYDKNIDKYFEFTPKLEDNLLKIKVKTPKGYLDAINHYEKEKHLEKLYYEKHKKELEEKDNQEFMKYVKIIGAIILFFVLFVIFKLIFFGRI